MKCLKPFKKHVNGSAIDLPCGSCPNCIIQRKNDWLTRVHFETYYHGIPLFITLTYNDDHLPRLRKNVATLRKRDVQLFIKRLRKIQSGSVHKYMAVGEYGTKTKRPHYHLLLWYNGTYDQITKSIQASWKLGEIHYGEAKEGNAAGYCCAYIGQKRYKQSQNPGQDPEFILFSKGLGAAYLTSATIEYHHRKNYPMFIMKDGQKVHMPRYYRLKIFSESTKQKQQFFYEAMNLEKPDISLANDPHTREQICQQKIIRLQKNKKCVL